MPMLSPRWISGRISRLWLPYRFEYRDFGGIGFRVAHVDEQRALFVDDPGRARVVGQGIRVRGRSLFAVRVEVGLRHDGVELGVVERDNRRRAVQRLDQAHADGAHDLSWLELVEHELCAVGHGRQFENTLVNIVQGGAAAGSLDDAQHILAIVAPMTARGTRGVNDAPACPFTQRMRRDAEQRGRLAHGEPASAPPRC